MTKSDLIPIEGRASLIERALIAYARYFPYSRGKLRIINALWPAAVGQRSPLRLSNLSFGKLRMECDLREMLQRQFHFFGTYVLEAEYLECWRQLATSADVIFDVGANVGIYSLAAASACPKAAVHAFEPTPEIVRQIRRNCEINNLTGIAVHETAIGNKNGAARLVQFRGENEDNHGQNYLAGESVPIGSVSLDVMVRSLDSIASELNIDRIDLMKVDVQGHEPDVLAGASELLRNGAIRTLFIELNWGDPDAANCPASASIDRLSSAGYVFAPLPAAAPWREAGPWLRAYSDIMSMPRSQCLDVLAT